MILLRSLLVLSLLQSSFIHAEIFIGRLSGTQNNIIIKSEKRGELKVNLPERFKFTMDHVVLDRPNYYYKLTGQQKGNTIIADQTPTIVAGPSELSGLYKTDGKSFFINGQKITFGRTKKIYNNQFDNITVNSFQDKLVNAQGRFIVKNGERLFEINAITLRGLFSVSPGRYVAYPDFKASPLSYILKEMPKNKNSQSRRPYRGNVIKHKNTRVLPGDPVFIITFSGRQGDAPDTVAGHFAIGMGEVDNNLEVKGELFNFYFDGPKEVPAGNTDLTSYFGHLIQGQNNYRPTYTVLVYGKTKKELKSVRDALEKDLHRVRTERGLGITPMYNCSTTAFRTLRSIDITGAHEHRRFNPKRLIFPRKKPALDSGLFTQLIYGLRSDYATFIPRRTFESLVKNITKRSKEMGITRMDYIFLPQYKSKRPVGGVSVGGLSQTVLFYGVSGFRALQIKKFEKAVLTLEDPKATKRDIIKAKKIIKKHRDDKDFQKTITKLMNIFF